MFRNMMACKSMIVAVTLLLAPPPASADWMKVAATGFSAFYVDPGTIRKTGSFVRVWTLIDNKYRPVAGARSVLTRREFDCSNSRYKFRGVTQYAEPMAGGRLIDTTDSVSDWFVVAPNTVGEKLYRFVCNQ